MARKASVGIQQLIDRTGGPRVRARIVVDQVYAQDQHETLHYLHPSGGRAKYLEAPMMEAHRGWIQDFANRFLNARRNTSSVWGASVGRPLVRAVARNAPRERSDLSRSASLAVYEGGAVVMFEPAAQNRLNEAALEVKDEARTDPHERGIP